MSWEISRKTTIAIYPRQVLARKKEMCLFDSVHKLYHFSLSVCFPVPILKFVLPTFVGSEIAGVVIETGERVKLLSKVITTFKWIPNSMVLKNVVNGQSLGQPLMYWHPIQGKFKLAV